jgi:hypothetical protein
LSAAPMGDVLWSSQVGRVWPFLWVWTAIVYEGEHTGEGSGKARTLARAEAKRDAWLRSMGQEP